MVYLLPFLSYLAGSKSISARSPVRLVYDDKYRSALEATASSSGKNRNRAYAENKITGNKTFK